MTNNFDYKTFSISLSEQAYELSIKMLNEKDKKYIKNTVYKYAYQSGEALSQDKSLNFTTEQIEFIVQVLAEWTYYRATDIIKAGMPNNLRDEFLSKIAFTIYEIAKNLIIRKYEKDEIIKIIEQHANKTYKENLNKLLKERKISKTVFQKAIEQSTIDELAQKEITKHNTNCSNNIKKINCVYKVLLITIMTIVLKLIIKQFDTQSITIIVNFMLTSIPIIFAIVIIYQNMIIRKKSAEIEQLKEMSKDEPNNLLEKEENNTNITLAENEEAKNNTNEMELIKRMGVDTISIAVAENLIPLVDVDQENQLMPKINCLRTCLTDKLGYILPPIRVMDCLLNDNEYDIYVRNLKVFTGQVYPTRIMVYEEDLELNNITAPEDIIVNIALNGKVCYWVTESYAEANLESIKTYSPADIIIENLKSIAIKHVDSIFTIQKVNKLISFIENLEENNRYKTIDNILKNIDIEDIRKILVHLIRENVSIKDIELVFDKINNYSRQSKDTIEIAEKVRTSLALQICTKYKSEENVLYCITFSKELEEKLAKSCQVLGLEIFFNLPDDEKNYLINTIIKTLKNAEHSYPHQPIILCSANNRYTLFKLLVKYIHKVVVLSYSELIETIKIEEIAKIRENQND